jgi:uncharacterized protein
LHITPANFDSMSQLCGEIRSRFGKDDRFRVNFQEVKNLGGEGGRTVLRVDETDFARRVHILTSIARGEEALPFEPARYAATGESASRQRAEEAASAAPYICYAAKPNSLLIRSNGRIGKCTVALSDPRNDVGYLAPDGTVKADMKKVRRWMRGLEALDPSALACPLDGLGGHASDEIGVTTLAGRFNAREIPIELSN